MAALLCFLWHRGNGWESVHLFSSASGLACVALGYLHLLVVTSVGTVHVVGDGVAAGDAEKTSKCLTSLPGLGQGGGRQWLKTLDIAEGGLEALEQASIGTGQEAMVEGQGEGGARGLWLR
jgi:hypothetical protein